MTYFAYEKMSSLEVRTPVQLQLRRVALKTNLLATIVCRLAIKIVQWTKLCQFGLLLFPIMLVLEKLPIIPKIMLA